MSSTRASPNPNQAEDRLAPTYNQPPRKMASTGGGRAWSEEEENYLIETRQHKMPYKHIAAHLNKTELACRLHYHQLSFGTKRRHGRRRTSSVSSARSSVSNHSSITESNNAAGGLAQQRPLPQLSPPDSPEHRAAASRSQSPQALPQLPQALYHHQQQQHQGGNPVPILPKPVCSTGAQPAQPALAPNNALRLITADVERYEERNRIDKARLARIYDAHRGQFWSAVARDYGENVAPHVLEEVWWRQAAGAGNNGASGPAGHFPPTPPNRSPQQTQKPSLVPHAAPSLVEIPPTATFRPVNAPTPPPQRSSSNTPSLGSRTSSFAISSLLTEDKEISTTSQAAPQAPSVAAH